MIQKQIAEELKKVIKDLTGLDVEPRIERSSNEAHGDYVSNVALTTFSSSKFKVQSSKFRTPLELAEEIVNKIKNQKSKIKNIERIEAAKPGFINFWLSQDYLVSQLQEALEGKEGVVGTTQSHQQQSKIMVEFAHPNPLKAFHIGHLRNITTGESIVRLLEAAGNKIIRANYEGDVGMHIAKALYGLLQISNLESRISNLRNKSVKERVEFLGEVYVAGSKAYEEDDTAKQAIKNINFLVYAAAQRFQEERGIKPSSTDYTKFVESRTEEQDKIYELWKETRQWSLDHFEEIYKRVYSRFDRYYFESECLSGVDIAREAVEKGVLEKSDGAIIFNGKPYGLDTRVFVNSLGLPTYEAKELSLAQKEFTEFGELDRVIHVVGPEQSSFFKITFKVEELLNQELYDKKQYHMIYGWVRLKHGKMSSRTGQVVLGEWLLDETKAQIKKQFPEMDEETAEMVAVGAVKYSMLKFSTGSDISFSFEESISLEGNSGPYIQYSFARTQSIINKFKSQNSKVKNISQAETRYFANAQDDKADLQAYGSESLQARGDDNIQPEELSLLRSLSHFPEVVGEAAINYSPNIICNYLFDLAQKFNLFYQKHKVIGGQSEELRLLLVRGVGQTLKNGLHLLGIQAPEKM